MWTPWSTPFFVISWNSTRATLSLGFLISSEMWNAIASPSRSGSVARSTSSAFFAADLSSSRTFSLPSMTS
ncbi:hypothetical protein SCE1572_31035 [Sorangium cellulosum So0157-2]|uniref:Uncharacterized protein n=1 Tax=Sorangium cellulosum So0157-2 TaxID=1254432 RepID=S4Y228_SORCE|nr:hypothetical protein SCE1572_31035 [Sorangium cellulosum So0157-2]